MRIPTSVAKLLTIILLMVSFTASGASYDFESGGLRFKILSGTDRAVSVVDIAGNREQLKKMVIPSKVISDSKTYDVTEIGKDVFFKCYHLTSVTIPNSVTAIGEAAFMLCSALTSVTIPNSVMEIGAYAFDCCSALTSVTIPNSVMEIGEAAFIYCSRLTSVTIPNSVTAIGDYAFSSCYALSSVNVDSGNSYYSSIEGVLYNKNASTILRYPPAKNASSFSIPNSVMEIGESAFDGCQILTTVTIPNSVMEIGESAFEGCLRLTSVTIPNSVTAIGRYLFRDCWSLTSVTIPNSVMDIDQFVFNGCSKLRSIYMQREVPLNTLLTFEDELYMDCTLYVPAGTLEAYKKVDPWRNFWTIEEMEYSGINDVGTDNEDVLQFSVNDGVLTIIGIGEDQAINIYDMHGGEVYRGVSRTIENLAHGIYIVKVGNKAMKVKI